MLLIATGLFLRKYFGPVLPDQVLYHLQQGGMDQSDPRLISRGLRYFAVVVVATVLLLLLHRRLPLTGQVLLAVSLVGTTYWSLARAIDSRCVDHDGDYLADHYVDPAQVTFTGPAQLPDVLVVFVESLETAHVDGVTFGGSLAPNLAEWRDDHGSYGQMLGLGGASWTMGGMFSTLCGVPLQAVGMLQHNAYEYGERFFSHGTCLPDLLAAQGYEASFYGGASLKFAGKGKFLQAHHVTRRFGADEWRTMGIDVPTEAWGLPDTQMLAHAWRDMQRPRTLGPQGIERPRLDMVLTVDSHPPAGITDPGCAPGTDAPITVDERSPGKVLRHAFQCTDWALHKLLVQWSSRSDGRDKVILVQGDHLSMKGSVEPQLVAYAAQHTRTVYHALARFDGKGRQLPPLGLKGNRQFTHLDLMPTVLAEAGFSWSDPKGHLALGTALVSSKGTLLLPKVHPTLVERDGHAQVDGQLACQSAKFAAMW